MTVWLFIVFTEKTATGGISTKLLEKSKTVEKNDFRH